MSLSRFQFLIKTFGLLCITVALFLTFSSFILPKKQSVQKISPQQESQVLGASFFPTPTPVIVLPKDVLTSLQQAPVISQHVGHPTKSSYVIAVYGDSLEDTMGNRVERLSSLLTQLYPSIHFSLYNYGIGAQNVEQGLERFDNIFTYKGRNYPPLRDIKPDIIIVGSFAYNPFTPPDPEKHKMLLMQLVQKAKSTRAKVYLLAEIAPLGTDFGKGPSGMAQWTDEYRLSHAKEIVEQMKNVFSAATSTNTPLIDVYDKTKTNGPFGSWQYTTATDGIHPSETGQSLTASEIAHSIF